jgi:hypothetical protein
VDRQPMCVDKDVYFLGGDLISSEAFNSGAYGDAVRCEDVGSEAAMVDQFA